MTETEPTPPPPTEIDYEALTRLLWSEIHEYGHPVTGRFARRQVLLLTTIGAKTGLTRTSALAFSRDENAYVITASKGGAPDHPGWFHNLEANPEATVEADLETVKVRARVAEGVERQRLWEQHIELHPGIGAYPALTDRVIPVVVLEPVAG